MKNIAIVTGASGGLGKEFAALMCAEDVSEIWCVGRNEEKLKALKSSLGGKILPLRLDLALPESIEQINSLLKSGEACVKYLVNNAGIGERLGTYSEYPPNKIAELVSVNCTSVAALCTVCIPYMKPGGKIINIASQSSFQPVPYLNLYASSKAFVRSYTRALNAELKELRISATAVCPGWVDTDMLIREINGKAIKYPFMVKAAPVALKALADAKKGKDMSVYGFYVKYMHFLAKVFPQKTVMRTWISTIKKYLK